MKKTWNEPVIENLAINETAKSPNGNGWGQCKPNNGVGHGSNPYEGLCS